MDLTMRGKRSCLELVSALRLQTLLEIDAHLRCVGTVAKDAAGGMMIGFACSCGLALETRTMDLRLAWL